MRLRQVVVAAADLNATVTRLQQQLGLGVPYHDPGVGFFGLRNAVFAMGDTFVEVVSPEQPDTAAGRFMERRGGDAGYMVMLQIDDLPAARDRAGQMGIREVFEVEFDDIAEVHLHPSDMGGVIVSLSTPRPVEAWRWGGPDWADRSVPGGVRGVEIGVADPAGTAAAWASLLGAQPSELGITFASEDAGAGLRAIAVEGLGEAFTAAGVRFDAVGGA